MGVKILQLMAGRDFAIEKNVLNPIQTKLYEFAVHMKNIIHVIVDRASKQCILVDAVNENILKKTPKLTNIVLGYRGNSEVC